MLIWPLEGGGTPQLGQLASKGCIVECWLGLADGGNADIHSNPHPHPTPPHPYGTWGKPVVGHSWGLMNSNVARLGITCV